MIIQSGKRVQVWSRNRKERCFGAAKDKCARSDRTLYSKKLQSWVTDSVTAHLGPPNSFHSRFLTVDKLTPKKHGLGHNAKTVRAGWRRHPKASELPLDRQVAFHEAHQLFQNHLMPKSHNEIWRSRNTPLRQKGCLARTITLLTQHSGLSV